MDNKKFVIIFAVLLVIMISLATYSAIRTANQKKEERIEQLSMEEFNQIILQSKNFQEARVNDITKEALTQMIDIEEEKVDRVYGKKSILSTDASLYLLIEPKEEYFEEVNTKLEEFGNQYENEWSNYLEAEYDLVVDRRIGSTDHYLYLIICEDSYDLENYIKIEE